MSVAHPNRTAFLSLIIMNVSAEDEKKKTPATASLFIKIKVQERV